MKKILLIIILLLTPTLVNAETNYLYDVLKNEAENNGLAKEYTGEHHDSFIKEPSKKIYHWYAENDDEGNQVIEKNNVIFGGFCWQMIRTTDTGGVKLIYNGVPDEDKCNNNGNDSTIGLSSFNQARNSVAYAGYMFNPDTALISRTDEYTPRYGTRFAESFSYSDNNFNLINTSSILNTTHHYGCLNGLSSCSQIAYYYWLTNGYYQYIVYDSNKTIDEVLNDMLSSNNVNSSNSNIKELIDNWYQENLNSFSNFIEDTIYCNDRSIIDLGGWNPNGGNTNGYPLKFKNNDINQNLICTNETDKFSISNDLAKLDYPVGLLTRTEFELLNNNIIRKTGVTYYTLSPGSFYVSSPEIISINSSGSISVISNITTNQGIRPSISLKSKTKYNNGDGSKENPYIIDTSNYYKVIVEEPVKKGDIEFEVEDISNLQEGEEVKFKIKPVKGYVLKDLSIIDEEDNDVDYKTTDNINFKFTMPATDVIIKPQYKEIESNILNPQTKGQILLIIISIIIVGIITTLYIKKKKRLT